MSGSTQLTKKWGDTISKRGEVSRVFVGNTDYKLTTCDDLEKIFSVYGRINGIDINPNGFSFVQFAHLEDALRAVNGENGTLLKQRKLEVRMFDKSGPPKKKPYKSRGRSRSPLSNRSGPTNPRFSPQCGPFSNPPPFDQNQNNMGPPPPMQPPSLVPGNDIEIIVVNKDQWAYAEMIERRFREETPIEYIDLLFLHSPQHISLTLNDLFERRTLYAIVVTPINEEHKSCTLHMLHNQTEHRNIPIEEVIPLLSRDYLQFVSRNGLQKTPQSPLDNKPLNDPFGFPNSRPQPQAGPHNYLSTSSLPPPLHSSFNSPSTSNEPLPPGNTENLIQSNSSLAPFASANSESSSLSEKRLPEEIAYLLKTTLSENGVQFLSLSQIDSIINYFIRERDRLTSQAPRRPMSTSQNDHQSRLDYPSSEAKSYPPSNPPLNSTLTNNLLDNPQLKAALNSLLQIGAIGNTSSSQSSMVKSFNKMGTEVRHGMSTTNDPLCSEAPSYMSTTSNQESTVSSHISNQSSYPASNLTAMSGPQRRQPLFPTNVSGASGSGYSSSLRFNSPLIENRDYTRPSHRY